MRRVDQNLKDAPWTENHDVTRRIPCGCILHSADGVLDSEEHGRTDAYKLRAITYDCSPDIFHYRKDLYGSADRQ